VRELGMQEELIAVPGLTPPMLAVLADKGILKLDDLADLASDEFVEMLRPIALSEQDANAIIMAARAHWFEGEQTKAQEAPGTQA